MRSMDSRFARILGKLGHKPIGGQVDDMKTLRADYQSLAGKKPFHGWKADDLRSRIDELTAPTSQPEPVFILEAAPADARPSVGFQFAAPTEDTDGDNI
jgi:hypothetical protein